MKRFISLMLALLMVFSFAAAASADNGDESGETKLFMHMDNNGKVITYADGTRANGIIYERCYKQLYYLLHNVPINWSLFDYAELEMTLDADNRVTITKQTMYANDGKKLVNADPNVAILDTPTKLHATGAGSTTIEMYNADGELIETGEITVTGTKWSDFELKNICSKCGEDQSNGFHVMDCGHFKCVDGEEGHAQGACGYEGHYECDGEDHSLCYNCHKGLCTGEHGEGVCPHEHTPEIYWWDRKPTCTAWGVARIRCSVCGYGFVTNIPPKGHDYNAQGKCTVCGAMKPAETVTPSTDTTPSEGTPTESAPTTDESAA